MTNKSERVDVYMDFLPNQPKSAETRAEFSSVLRAQFERSLPEAVERIWDLPAMMLTNPSAAYVALLVQARELYVSGTYYACVAMCGIVGERITKDVLRTSLLVRRGNEAVVPSEAALDQFERVEVRGLISFAKESALLSSKSADAAIKLGELRNKYAHARGQKPQEDALTAIKLLHVLVEDTVSVFKEYDIKDGILVRRTGA